MPHFIWENGTLPGTKTNLFSVTNPSSQLSATEFNTLIGYMADIQSTLQNGETKDRATTVSSAGTYRFKSVSGKAWLSENGGDFQPVIPTNRIHIAKFAPAGNGSTDDWQKIQNAIDAAIAADCALEFDSKTYAVAKELIVTGPINFRIIGTYSGDSCTTFKSTAAARSTLCLKDTTATITDLRLDANQLADFGMYSATVSFSFFQNVWAERGLFDGIFQSNRKDVTGRYLTRGTTAFMGRVIGGTSGNWAYVASDSQAGGASAASGTLQLYWPHANGVTQRAKGFSMGETLTCETGATATFDGYSTGTAITLDYTGRNATQFSGTVTGGTSAATMNATADTLAGGATGAGGTTGTVTGNKGGFLNGETITAGAASATVDFYEVGTATVNDNNVWVNCFFNNNGLAYVTDAFNEIRSPSNDGLRTYYVATSQCVHLPSARVTTTAGSTVVNGTGTTFITWGIRAGATIIIATAGSKRYFMVTKIVSETQLEVAATTTATMPTANHTNVEFAILEGDGYHEQRHGDNNIHQFMGGLCRSNANAGLAWDGLYGNSATRVQFDFLAAWAIRLGSVGSSPVKNSKIDTCYFEALGRKPVVCGNTSGALLIEPMLDKAYVVGTDDPWDYAFLPGTGYIGMVSTVDHIRGNGFNSYIPTMTIGEVGGTAAWSGAGIGYNDQQMTVSGATIAPTAEFVKMNAGSPQTVTTITAPSFSRAGSWFTRVTFRNNSAHNITFTAGANLLLTAASVVVAPTEAIDLYHVTGSVWIQMGHSTQSPNYAGTLTTNALVNTTGVSTSSVADGASAVGFDFKVTADLANAGAKIFSFKDNASTEQIYATLNGALFAGLNVPVDTVAFSIPTQTKLKIGTAGGNDVGLHHVASAGRIDFLTNASAVWVHDGGGTSFSQVRIKDAKLKDGSIEFESFTDDGANTGNRTVNKWSGINAFAGAATSITITNDKVTASSKVMATLMTADATATGLSAVVNGAGGSFTLNLTAAATGTTKVYWQVFP